MKEVFLSLGSNLGDRKENILKAIQHIEKDCGKLIKESSFYETSSWGFLSDNKFYNKVICINCLLKPIDLLNIIQDIENLLGRKKIKNKASYESRIIDIDILFYGREIIKTDLLIVPHKDFANRNFELMPMAELAPEFLHPIYQLTVVELLKNSTDKEKVVKLQF